MKFKLHHHLIRPERRLERRGARSATARQPYSRQHRIAVTYGEEALYNLEDAFGVNDRFVTPDLTGSL